MKNKLTHSERRYNKWEFSKKRKLMSKIIKDKIPFLINAAMNLPFLDTFTLSYKLTLHVFSLKQFGDPRYIAKN